MHRSLFHGVVAALSLTGLSLVFAPEAHSAPVRPTVTSAAMWAHDYSWCLQYDGANDCAFNTRHQCEATAAGRSAECVPSAPATRGRD
jgi:hypothetical protein